MISRGRKGLTLLELILVLVIVTTLAGLGFPLLRRGIENHEAREALKTLRSLAQAVRLYELDYGNFLDGGVPPQPITLLNLEQEGYVNSREYAPGFQYLVDVSSSAAPFVQACRPDCLNPSARLITLNVFAAPATGVTVKGQDGTVSDSVGFL